MDVQLNLIDLLCLFIVIFQVLSHNLCTVLAIPHDPVALEEHFRDDDDGPVSSQGYMPYLNKYILDKVMKRNTLFCGFKMPLALYFKSFCPAGMYYNYHIH